ncbi:MAG: UvrD-helicase domain-containing protein [Clostridiaceae bacterium]
MALIYCPECKKQISDKAEACPHCGLPKKYFPYSDSDGSTQESFEAENPANSAISITADEYKSIRNMLIAFSRDYIELFNIDQYISSSKVKRFFASYEKYFKMLKNPVVQQYIMNHAGSIGSSNEDYQQFISRIDGLYEKADRFNNDFVNRKLFEYKEYFDNMLKAVDPNVKLDDEQRRAVITDEDYCLLIAGAGAGKTTTMAAKARYLVEKQGVKPQDIIVISYTNKAIDELKERINNKLGIPVNVCTFHKFGYDILKKSVEIPPTINFKSYSIVFEFLEKKVFGNPTMLKNLVLFLGYYFDLPEDIFKFKTLNEYNEYKATKIYETIKSRLGEYILNVINRRSRKVRTITGEFLRSVQEVQIANFLYLNSIEYEYEKPYKYRIPDERKKYTPDFHISQGEKECYLEHFGVTESYQSNIYNKKELEKYVYNITRKRSLHKYYNTELIQTYSEYNDGRPLIEHLKEELAKKGFILVPRDLTDVYRKLTETGKDRFVMKFIMFMIEFIGRYKTSGYDEGGFAILKSKTDNVRTLMFLDIAEEVYRFYQDRLLKNNQIDYSDMINDAERMLMEMRGMHSKPSYKYIIIDEFQDIARQRFNLTKALVDVTGAKVIAVGDDWQSIFAFAGSDITLFQRFLELMGDGKEMQITHTYRNSQQLIDIAGNFIQKNPTQIKKRLISPKSLENPVIVESFDDHQNYRKNWVSAIEKVIDKIVEEYGEKTSILMIGRYNYDMDWIARSGPFVILKNDRIRYRKYPHLNIKFLTAHSSKGLGFDNVILVNMNDSKYGFPSQLEDDPIMKLVTYKDNVIEYAEERRLFYVALTRTKNRVYMVTPLYRPSRFVVELIKDFGIPHDDKINLGDIKSRMPKCPICGMPMKFENNKNYGIPLYICLNDPEICDFMTNDEKYPHDIFKCPACKDGYMIVKPGKVVGERFYGCTNFSRTASGCRYTKPIYNTCDEDVFKTKNINRVINGNTDG